jgi:hypothetical protein
MSQADSTLESSRVDARIVSWQGCELLTQESVVRTLLLAISNCYHCQLYRWRLSPKNQGTFGYHESFMIRSQLVIEREFHMACVMTWWPVVCRETLVKRWLVPMTICPLPHTAIYFGLELLKEADSNSCAWMSLDLITLTTTVIVIKRPITSSWSLWPWILDLWLVRWPP